MANSLLWEDRSAIKIVGLVETLKTKKKKKCIFGNPFIISNALCCMWE